MCGLEDVAAEIDYDAIVTFDQLAAAYDQLAERIRSVAAPVHLGGHGEIDDLLAEDGERLIVSAARNGHHFTLVMAEPDRPKPFFVVPNERGKTGGAGGYSTAREILRGALDRPLGQMANAYAWATLGEEHGFGHGGVPKHLYDDLRPEADALRHEELQRLLDLLGTDWP